MPGRAALSQRNEPGLHEPLAPGSWWHAIAEVRPGGATGRIRTIAMSPKKSSVGGTDR
jgi:hypothetical protein